ncbi:MAG TPA: TIGR02221 family CRISPR-associated protein [Cryomorphaceae bacterium]|nr:TIGR02221 family CRISPR-associated protein [Cryomorphaceae bacterium]
MARNILISFLGTSAYKEAHYQLKDECSENVTFIQEALLRLLFPKPSDNDQFFIFLTKGAKEKNWQDNGHRDRKTKEIIQLEGLKSRLTASGHIKNTQVIDIPFGQSTAEIWQIFEAVFQQIQSNDQVYLDITHGFRSIPMLSMTLLNYARALKNIELKGIYYGAWEARDIDSNVAPVFNLTPLDEIQRWSSAVNQFIKYGQVEELNMVLKETYTPRLAESEGKDPQAHRLRQLDQKTSEMAGIFTTNRGKSIEDRHFFENYIKIIEEKPAEEEEWDHFMDSLRKKITQKVQPFASMEGDPNWLLGVKWCIDHNLIQQGITQLQEGIVTYIINEFKELHLSSGKIHDRNFVKKALNLCHIRKSPGHKQQGNDWNKFPSELGEKIINLPIVEKIAGKFCSFSSIRNRINHAGISKDDQSSFNDFKRELNSFYTYVKNIIFPIPLINLSNHASEKWSDTQRRKALEIAEEIIDIPFPTVPPEADEIQIEVMAQETVDKVLQYNPSHVHIMGEFTLTYRMVRKLKAHDVTCIASTSKRKVSTLPDNSRKVKFDFSTFRKY